MKKKVTHLENVYPVPMQTENAIYCVSSQWVTNMQQFKDAVMPVMVFTWQVGEQTIMAMHHQSFN